jgi:SAM-dependent methyltransferase
MEHVACDFCGETGTSAVTRQTDILHRVTDEIFTIVRCSGCGLQYLNPRPTRSEIGRYYAEQYSFHAEPSNFNLRAGLLLNAVANGSLARLFGAWPVLSRKLAARVKPAIADPVMAAINRRRGLRILDIGCGSGISAHFWGHRGALLHYRRYAEVCGIEIDEQARAALHAAGIRACGDIAEIAAAERFDVIRMNWSLEHVHSPNDYFAFIAAHLAAQGRAVIAVPNYDGLLYRVAPDCVELPIHLYHFRKQDILNYARRHGFTVAGFHAFSYPEMYVVAAAACPSLRGSFDDGLGITEASQLQKTLSRFDALGLGNDMLFVLEKSA